MIIKANPGFKAVFVRDRGCKNIVAWLEFEDIIAWEINEGKTPSPITIKHGILSEKRNDCYLCAGIKNQDGEIITSTGTHKDKDSYTIYVNKKYSFYIQWGI
jgi:hypothetical protein